MGALSVSEFAELWFEKHVRAKKVPSAGIKDVQNLSKYFFPLCGSKALNEVKLFDIDSLVANLVLEARLKPKTINNILGSIKKMFQDAVRWEFVEKNPAIGIKPLKLDRAEVTYLFPEEVRILLEYTCVFYKREHELMVFAVNTGCRLGECLGLTWNKISFGEQRALVDSIYDSFSKKIVQRTKGKRFRVVPLNGACLRLLERMRAGGEGDSEIFRVRYDYFTHEKCRPIYKLVPRQISFSLLRS